MIARYMIENPDKIECTMTITMSLKHWEELRDQLHTKWPSGQLFGMITDLMCQARKVFYPEHKTTGL